jgi:hypothetical protein
MKVCGLSNKVPSGSLAVWHCHFGAGLERDSGRRQALDHHEPDVVAGPFILPPRISKADDSTEIRNGGLGIGDYKKRPGHCCGPGV